MQKPQLTDFLIEVLGPVGSNKSLKMKYPDFKGHILIHKANIRIPHLGKIWHGDLDFTTDEAKLKKLARKLNCSFYILKEMDGRFSNEYDPKYEKSLIKVTPTKIYLGDQLQVACHRNKSGKLVLIYDLSFLYD